MFNLTPGKFATCVLVNLLLSTPFLACKSHKTLCSISQLEYKHFVQLVYFRMPFYCQKVARNHLYPNNAANSHVQLQNTANHLSFSRVKVSETAKYFMMAYYPPKNNFNYKTSIRNNITAANLQSFG